MATAEQIGMMQLMGCKLVQKAGLDGVVCFYDVMLPDDTFSHISWFDNSESAWRNAWQLLNKSE